MSTPVGIGDRVMVTGLTPTEPGWTGKVGTVTHIDFDPVVRWHVRFDGESMASIPHAFGNPRSLMRLEFAVGDRVRNTLGETGTVDEIVGRSVIVSMDDDGGRAKYGFDSVEKITPRVGHDRFQPGDKVKYRAGRTKRASRIGTVVRTGVDMDGASFAVVTTPGGVSADVDYDELELVRAHGEPEPSTGEPRRITLTFTYTPDKHIPFIRDLDNLLEILSESPDDLTITEERP